MARGGLLGLLALPVPILLLLMWALGWLHWAFGRTDAYLRGSI
jgi:hypothetical protein